MIPYAKQIKAARALLGWSQTKLAEEAGCARNSVSRFEAGSRDTRLDVATAVTTALEEGGIIFLPSEIDVGVGVRLKKPEPKRGRSRRGGSIERGEETASGIGD